MAQASVAASDPQLRSVDSSLMLKVFYAFLALALLSLAISFGGRWFGHAIAMGGHTDDRSLREIVIGNNVIAVPANSIRFERARRNGVSDRLDLYLRWPDLEGYSEAARNDFNHADGARRIVFLTFEHRMMSRDMSGRFAPIYSSMIVKPGEPGPANLTFYNFIEKSGYLNEVLAVGLYRSGDPFVARCLTGESAEQSLAPCERDIYLGDDLSLTYRFPRELLGEWQEVDKAIRAKAVAMLKIAH